MIEAIAVVAVIVGLVCIINEHASFIQTKRRQGVLTLCPTPGEV